MVRCWRTTGFPVVLFGVARGQVGLAGTAAKTDLVVAPDSRGHLSHSLFGLKCLGPFALQPLVIFQEAHQLFRLFPHVNPLVFPVPVDVLEVLERLYGKYVFLTLVGHSLRTRLDEIIQQGQGFVNMSPVLPVVIESLPDHAHDFRKGHHVIGQVGNLRHEGAGGTPRIVGGGLSHFNLCLRVIIDNVLHLSPDG